MESIKLYGMERDVELAAPQGFEPQYADSESAVLPLNEGAVPARARAGKKRPY